MKKRNYSLPLILGAGLILCSLGLMLFFRLQMQLGVKNAQQTFEILAQMLPDRTTGIPGGYAEAAMPALQIGSTDYVALLEIPSAGIALPVANTWDSNKLAFSPARFSGSAYDHTLVIGGADDPGQFGFCDQIDLGVHVTVTDMTGSTFSYTVSQVDRSDSAEVQWLTDSQHHLTLFCRDLYSMEYVAVRCDFAFG